MSAYGTKQVGYTNICISFYCSRRHFGVVYGHDSASAFITEYVIQKVHLGADELFPNVHLSDSANGGTLNGYGLSISTNQHNLAKN